MSYELDSIRGPLPDLFRLPGSTLTDAAKWPSHRQALVDAVVPLLFGGLPPQPQVLRVTYLFCWRDHIYSYLVETGTKEKTLSFELQVFTPKGPGPFPILLTGDGCFGYCTDQVIQTVNDRGFAVAKFNRLVFARDDYNNQERMGGLYEIYPEGTFGAIAAWAWGYHRAVDALAQIPIADSGCIAITGHSRGGKTTLLAGATDTRIGFIQDSASGAGGGGCFRYSQRISEEEAQARQIEDRRSEELADLMRVIPYWFGQKMHDYVDKEEILPFDLHFLKAAIAPRHLLLSNYLDDIWANPRGSYQTYLAAKQIYTFLGAEDHIAATYREGEHYHRPGDFVSFLDFIEAARENRPFSGSNADAVMQMPFCM